MPHIKPIKPDKEEFSKYFDLYQLAEGVYAAIGVNSPAAYSNAGIIDLGEQTLIFDTFATPQAGHALHKAAESLSSSPVEIVVISHAHSDHWMGNQAFDHKTLIITSHPSRLAMPAIDGYLRCLKNDPTELETQILETRQRLADAKDPRWQVTLAAMLARMQANLESLVQLAPRLPDQTFECRLVFHGSKRSLEVIEGSGHTVSDAYLMLPDERIIFLGDLGFFQRQPYMPNGDPNAWQAQLAVLETIDAEIIVPGHGPLGDESDLALQREYIHVLQALVDRVYLEGGALADIQADLLPAPFDRWLPVGMNHFEANVKALFQRISAA